MNYSLNSLKGVYRGIIGDYYGGTKGDTRSLDYSSCRSPSLHFESQGNEHFLPNIAVPPKN